MILTPDQLADLTDKKRAKDQIAWLVEHGFRFEISAIGRPKVLVAEVEAKMLSPDSVRKTQKPAEPNFAAVNTN